jgi:hypothetical protein
MVEPKADSDSAAKDTAGERLFSVGNLKWLIGTLSLPVVLLLLSTAFQQSANERSRKEIAAANERASADNRARLYTELLQKREDADAGVRRDVFNKLVDKYMVQSDLDSRLVMLELLALNFHESLTLSPLFWQLDRHIARGGGDERVALRGHLDRIAQGVKDRQFALLAPEDFSKAYVVDLSQVPNMAIPGKGCVGIDRLTGAAQAPQAMDAWASYSDLDAQGASVLHRRQFRIEVDCHDPLHRRLFVIVTDVASSRVWKFWVDPYDFPLANFTLVSRDERFALLLDLYDDGNGYSKLRLAHFPASRGGAKDKPHIADVMARLALPDPSLTTPGAGPVETPASAPSAPASAQTR